MAAAFGLHALVIVLLMLAPTAGKSIRTQLDSVSVEIIVETTRPAAGRGLEAAASPPQVSLTTPSAPAISAAQQRAVGPPPASQRGEPVKAGMETATYFYASAVLAAPRNAQALIAMGSLADDERAVQICNLEAMEQAARIRESLYPDFVVAYATADVVVLAEDLVIADGAALRSGPDWFALRYRCKVRPDRRAVVEFSYALEDVIPRSRWQHIGLPEGRDSN